MHTINIELARAMPLLTSCIITLYVCYWTFLVAANSESEILNSWDHIDPTEFFTGSQYRPKLEIVRPENGQVLSDGVLDIEIDIFGIDLPSHFDESSTCIALSKDKGFIVVEHCFDQSSELIFHVNGLTPGEAYSLRVLFLERGKVIALSVRSFRVGGVIGVLAGDESRPVSIQTALQVALKHQVNGMHAEAEQIYQRILSESPSNADALNHLGVNFHQQGDHLTAIAYMQQALVSDHAILADSYYNLGEVYRVIGRIDLAKDHFERSLSMNPNLTSSMFKLGLIYQQNLRQFELARSLYHRLLKLELTPGHKTLLSKEELHECKVRECDMLNIVARDSGDNTESYEVLNCWKEGIAMFPSSGLLFNELGNNYLLRGMHEAAFQSYSSAVKLDFFLAFVNRASVLEIQGYIAEASLSFQESIAEAIKLNLPHFHVRMRLATLLPRVLPSSHAELKGHRQTAEMHLDDLLASKPPLNVENAAPINYGFSTGYYLAFHGQSNLSLKQKMYRLYILFCPALSYGHFSSVADTSRHLLSTSPSSVPQRQDGDVYSPRSQAEHIGASGVGAVCVMDASEWASDEHDGLAGSLGKTSLLYWGEEHLGEWEELHLGTQPAAPPGRTGNAIAKGNTATDFLFYHPLTLEEPPAVPSLEALHDGEECDGDASVIRVGFVSRFFYSHPVGFLFEEVIRILSAAKGGKSDIGLTVEVFMLEAKNESTDPVSNSIQRHANAVHKVAPDLNKLVDAIRLANLDILVYTDLGLDPITYFASFSRLAPVQVTGLGHADTSGVSTIDYYVSDDVELPHAMSLYSETLVQLPGMGSCFVDRAQSREQAVTLQSPRTALLDRAKYIEKIGIPRSAHLYVIVQPLYTLHSSFDECIARIMTQDKLGYIVILNPGNTWHSSHHTLFFNRLSSRLSEDAVKRILTFQYLQTNDFIHKSIAAAHVLLDPFPGGSYLSSLHALSMGIPVITFPSQFMSGRQCLSLYKRMGYMDLVVSSPLEFATLALTLAHKPKIRQNHVNLLMKYRSKLFDCSSVEKNWVTFFLSALESMDVPKFRNRTLSS